MKFSSKNVSSKENSKCSKMLIAMSMFMSKIFTLVLRLDMDCRLEKESTNKKNEKNVFSNETVMSINIANGLTLDDRQERV